MTFIEQVEITSVYKNTLLLEMNSSAALPAK